MFAELARNVPSSAGFYFDESGDLVVRVRDDADAERAKVEIDALTRTGRVAPPSGLATGLRHRIAGAQFTFRQLSEWRDLAFDNAFTRVKGVNSLDLDERQNRIVLGLDPANFAQLRLAVTSSLNAVGVDTTALAFDSAGPSALDVAPPVFLSGQTSDPLAGGLLIMLLLGERDTY